MLIRPSGLCRQNKNVISFCCNNLYFRVWEVQIKKAYKSSKKLRGGDVLDFKFATMAFYLDAVQVDKRTYEYFKQASHEDPRLEGHLNVVT
ncbi:hypothetical protein A7Q10_03605 [Methylacidiphilum caldifontis]|uniref:Uncharacterized protein n=1 Tax=Methylacidiphilum caldifontis TaxID=2795386 RepID=A0A4Y8PH88_9BACT|nr:hypothetical protein A7Q10_03605 [Methylacidiphilum caldifontis]